MKSALEQKRLDIMITTILLLLLLLAGIFRASPLDFMNPEFPILRPDELAFSEDFFLEDEPEIERATSVYDFSEVRYDLVFRMNRNVVPEYLKFLYGVQSLTRFSSPGEAAQALQNSYKKYLDHEENFLIQITDVPLDGFVSKADHYLVWCTQYREITTFDAREVHVCYYWAVYGSYLSQFSLFSNLETPYPLDLFVAFITRAENKILSKLKTEK